MLKTAALGFGGPRKPGQTRGFAPTNPSGCYAPSHSPARAPCRGRPPCLPACSFWDLNRPERLLEGYTLKTATPGCGDTRGTGENSFLESDILYTLLAY